MKKVLAKVLANFRGRVTEPEYNSGVPITVVSGIQRPLSIQEMVRKYIREEVSSSAVDGGEDSFEEDDDFSEDDPDVLPLTHHEVIAMDEDTLRGVAAGYGVDLVDEGSSGRPEADASPPGPAKPAGVSTNKSGSIPASGSPGAPPPSSP